MKNTQTQHYQWFDLLRFLAAFAVLVCHGRGFFLPEYAALPLEQRNIFTFAFYSLTRLGGEAVVIFFVLSGFLVGGKGSARIAAGTFNCKSYFIDRFSRIFPPLFGCTLFYCVAANFYQAEPVNYYHCLGNLLSLQWIFCPAVVEPFWSLAYEVWFYILLGLIAVFISSDKVRNKILTLFCLGGVGWILTKLKMEYMFILFMGIGAYFIKIPQPRFRQLIFILVLFVSALTVSQIAFTSNAFSDLLVIPPTVANLFLAFTVCLLIVWLANFNCIGKIAVGINLIAEKLAAFSYTLYLSHVVTFRLLQYAGFKRAEKLDCQSILSYTFCIAASLITAYLLYWCFERQTPYIKKALKRLLKL